MSQNELERVSDEQPTSLPFEFLLFLRDNRKWWLLPILLVLGCLGLLAALAPSGAAPFIYSLF